MGTLWPIYVRKKGKSLTGNIRCETENIKQMHSSMLFVMHTFYFTKFTVVIVVKRGPLEKLLFF